MGEAAPWGGSSMAVGMAANPHEAHQAGRHMVQPHEGRFASHELKAGGRVGKGCVGQLFSPGMPLTGTGRSSIGQIGSPVARSNT